ncbi:ABC transporter permease [Lacrimispora saccharolytica]|uniref:Binding-protein-dependent transport systems inner membrane component n=1 Tax=Lacrimispora saccharolytica (strain ATCC 35040 / DSM 2544 / NRCC 2533 / WM1) TaxID=610130 RepID=D9R1E5_LACSW|nr:ABC transporter permease [Lacrimispora saccharolytica]ADL06468.1 binding-protein-dependent transport systems inner membrane component [[Clostridium] saccharolyticum WM1]
MMKSNEKNTKKSRSLRVDSVLLALKHDKAAVISLFLLGLIILFAFIAPLLPVEPNATNIVNRLQPPSAGHWFGTDEVGRDYFARVIYGSRVSLLVGFLAMLTSLTIGVAVGTVSGLCGGMVDMILMRIVDVLYSIPWMILVTVVSIFLRPGLKSIILVIGFFTWMEIARLVRAETLSLKEREFILYAEFSGVGIWKIIIHHIIPSVFPTIIVSATTSMANAIMTESSLSFLGVGIQQPMSSWGSLLQNAQGTMQNTFYMALIPGLLIIVTIFAFNKLGNLLRVFVEPKIMNDEKE